MIYNNSDIAKVLYFHRNTYEVIRGGNKKSCADYTAFLKNINTTLF